MSTCAGLMKQRKSKFGNKLLPRLRCTQLAKPGVSSRGFWEVRSAQPERKRHCRVVQWQESVPRDKLPQDVDKKSYHLDHIFEKQMFAYAFECVAKGYDQQHRPSELTSIAEYVRDEIVNEDGNFALTRAATNELKGAACWKFFDDSTTDHRVPDSGLNSYLLTAHRINTTKNHDRLQRVETKRICTVIFRSARSCQHKLDDENDNELLKDEVTRQLQNMIAAMQLK